MDSVRDAAALTHNFEDQAFESDATIAEKTTFTSHKQIMLPLYWGELGGDLEQ